MNSTTRLNAKDYRNQTRNGKGGKTAERKVKEHIEAEDGKGSDTTKHPGPAGRGRVFAHARQTRVKNNAMNDKESEKELSLKKVWNILDLPLPSSVLEELI